MSDHLQFNIDRTHRGQWTVTFSNPPINMFVPETIVELGALLSELETDASVKAQINRFGGPTETELQSSIDMFFPTLAWPSAQARRAKLRGIGYGIRSDFELNFGQWLMRFGPAAHDDADHQSEPIAALEQSAR